MLLGPPALQIDGPGRLDQLRKRLRGIALLDTLINMADSLVPCMMLQAPQVGQMGCRNNVAVHDNAGLQDCDIAHHVTEFTSLVSSNEARPTQTRSNVLHMHAHAGVGDAAPGAAGAPVCP